MHTFSAEFPRLSLLLSLAVLASVVLLWARALRSPHSPMSPMMQAAPPHRNAALFLGAYTRFSFYSVLASYFAAPFTPCLLLIMGLPPVVEIAEQCTHPRSRRLAISAIYIAELTFLYIILTNQPLYSGSSIILFFSAAIAAGLIQHCTRQQTHPLLRGFIQLQAFNVGVFVVLPQAILRHSGTTAGDPIFAASLAAAALIVLGQTLLTWATVAFALQGRGTPFPFDPPRIWVTTGPYRWVSNPMQMGICATWAGVALLQHNAWVSVAALVTPAWFVVFKPLCLGCSMAHQGAAHQAYVLRVRAWLPRWPAAH